MHRKCSAGCEKPLDNTVLCFICKAECHMTCYGLNKTVIKSIKEGPNLLFLCDECNENKSVVDANTVNAIVNNAENNENKQIFKAIDELKGMMFDMQNKMNKIEKPSYRNVVTGDIPDQSQPRVRVKRMRFENIDAANDNNRGTPTGRPKNAIIGTNDVSDDLSSVEPRKWIFVSQLHPSTSEQSLTTFVNKCLNDTENKQKIQTFALVPKEKNREELNFISFKVNIPESLCDAILTPEIWPKGIIVREFVSDSRRRRPTGHFLPNTPSTSLLK